MHNPGRHAKAVRFLAMAAVAALTAGCSASGASPPNDHEKVVQALTSLLAAKGKNLCLDRATHGAPLVIYRAMLTAPQAARASLAWHVPEPLQPPPALSDRQLFSSVFDSDRVLIAPPSGNGDRLPAIQQSQIEGAARALLVSGDIKAVDIPNRADRPAIRSRWWVLNRLWPDCTPVYTVSHPVVRDSIAFVSVTANHWGTTYAFRRDRGIWSPTAQWTNWLY